MCDLHVCSVCCGQFWSDCWQCWLDTYRLIVIVIIALIGEAGLVLTSIGMRFMFESDTRYDTGLALFIPGVIILSIYLLAALIAFIKCCCIARYNQAQQQYNIV
jgi:hypothetical protein